MVFNVLENLKCKVGSGTPLYLRNDAKEIETEVTKLSQNNPSFFAVLASTRRAISVILGKMELETSDLTL